ncbi:hypothetical protein [Mesorhizobium sp. LNHC229A00]|uniref:hypothetical protein n=1 Tax=Mesorhizobium sp. LNHC229A00 TaxID=1287240 RepID=UPI0003CDED85|nr:hypothetical protein [Mesorhizobium sp. LNHC229A00]ESY91340.1 hypothetical protein X741_24060 [Mesorhizobium sp. LNHC229A00]
MVFVTLRRCRPWSSKRPLPGYRRHQGGAGSAVTRLNRHAMLDRCEKDRGCTAIEVGRQFTLGHCALQTLLQRGKILGARAPQIRADRAPARIFVQRTPA